MHLYTLGDWTLEIDAFYQMVKDEHTAVFIDDSRDAVLIVSLRNGGFCVDRTFYPIRFEFVAGKKHVRFYVEEED